jgi:hypothetical protein
MQTAMNRVESRKHEIMRSRCNQEKAEKAMPEEKRLSSQRATAFWFNRVEEKQSVSALAKTKGKKLERLEKHKAALAERKKKEAIFAAEQAVISDRMAKNIMIGDMINYDSS